MAAKANISQMNRNSDNGCKGQQISQMNLEHELEQVRKGGLPPL
jgi:hypothetical protein